MCGKERKHILYECMNSIKAATVARGRMTAPSRIGRHLPPPAKFSSTSESAQLKNLGLPSAVRTREMFS